MLDQITHLFRLQAVIESGSMRKAAVQLNLTQPALTRSIALLEASFGEPLLERHSRGVRPTAFGEQVLSSSLRLSRFWDIVEADLKAKRSGESSTLRISAGPMWRAVVLPPLLSDLHAMFPNLTVELKNSNLDGGRDELLEGRVDVTFGGLQRASEPSQRLMKREFTKVKDRVVAREGHPLFQDCPTGEEIDPQRLLDYDWLVYNADSAYRDTTLHASVERLGKAPSIRLVCESLISAIKVLQTSDLLCILPANAIVDAINPRIVPLPVQFSRRAVSSGATIRAELADWPPLVALLDLCAARFS